MSQPTEFPQHFQGFFEPFTNFFARRETKTTFLLLMAAILSPDLHDKNAWAIAEHQARSSPQSFQRLLHSASFDRSSASRLHRQKAVALCQDHPKHLIFDDTGFIKSGYHTVGVQRQYTGTSGKIDNCQIAVFAALVSQDFHCLFDSRLYLPQSWISDPERRVKAGIPDDLAFATKPALALEMYERFCEEFEKPDWVSADSGYGDGLEFIKALYEAKQGFVVGISKDTRIFVKPPEKGAVAESVEDAVKRWKGRMKVVVTGLGSRGEVRAVWGYRRIYVSRQNKPRMSLWLLVRRSLSGEEKYFLCWSPSDVGLKEFARVAGERWKIEECFKEAKGCCGLDKSQVRKWEAWQRWVLFSMMGHLYLAGERGKEDESETRVSLQEVAKMRSWDQPRPLRDRLHHMHWSQFRRRHNHKAMLSHVRARNRRSSSTK